MAKKQSKYQGRRASRRFIVALLALALAGYCVLSSVQDKYDIDLGIPSLPAVSFHWLEAVGAFLGGEDAPSAPDSAFGELSVHFIDVGQAKSILIRTQSKAVLIDAGENGQGELVLSYLRAQGVKKLDVLIGTHPHSDHIGGMDDVIAELEIGAVIMPEIPDAIVPTTKTYTDVLLAIARKGCQITPATQGDEYDLGGGAKLTILGPVREYDDLNNLSVVTRLDYGGVSFLFTGDIEAAAELDLIASGRTLLATVLDVPHHGSKTSSLPEFLQAVAPEYAVISCGIDNSYGHPHRETVEALKAMSAQVGRTDLSGTVVISTDGKEIRVDTQK